MHAHSPRYGFTLIELSIVLVIIGLIIGGVLFGRDLIKSAEIRSIVASTEGFSAAVNTFRGKYNCLPGDCAKSTQLFAGSINGNGNGFIDAGTVTPEFLNVWHDLGAAKLVSGTYTAYNDTTEFQNAVTLDSLEIYAFDPNGSPKVKAGYNVNMGYFDDFYQWPTLHSAHYITYSKGTRDFIVDNMLMYVCDYYINNAPTQDAGFFNAAFAYGVDAKIDDGDPSKGAVIGFTPDPNYCTDGTITSRYDFRIIQGNCPLRIRVSGLP